MLGGILMSSYQVYKDKALRNPEVKKEYDALQPESVSYTHLRAHET